MVALVSNAVQEIMVLLQFWGGILGFFAHLLLAFLIFFQKKDFKQNFTTWMLAALIDAFISILIIIENGNFYLPLFCTLGAMSITIVLLLKKQINWKIWDSVTTIFVFICLFIWWKAGNTVAIISGIIASIICFIPLDLTRVVEDS